MGKMNEFISEDSNQFGPGTDLIVALMAVFLVMVTISSYLYSKEKRLNDEYKREEGGNFKLASASFPAGDFKLFPVTELVDKEKTRGLVRGIVDEYQKGKSNLPYIFIIGHANKKDALDAEDRSETARLERNWVYAGRRAAIIAGLMQEFLPFAEKEKMVVVTTGEFDKKYPEDPENQKNALVEIVFAREWKPPSKRSAQQSKF